MVRTNSVASFCGTEHKNKTSLYSAVCAIRDGSDATFEASSEELCRILRAAGELPIEPARTLQQISRTAHPPVSFRSKRHVALLSSLDQGFLLDKDGTDAARDAE